jgi:hypothetical protein
MATKDPAESVGEFLAELLKIVFSLTFPLMLITLCGASFVLVRLFDMPELGLWFVLAVSAVECATSNIWAAVALAVLVLAALPLAWVGVREREIRISKAILEWVITALLFAFIFWLRTVWPYSGSGWQLILFAFLLFGTWNGVIEAAMSTLVIVLHVRRNRPRPIAPPRQEPHGAQRAEPQRRDEPETI